MPTYSPDWHDMSEYVVHFTKDFGDRTPYDNMMGILSRRILRAVTAFGIARGRAPDVDNQRAVCFSEVPLHLLGRLAERRGPYGIGFSKEFLLQKGGGPIWYVEAGSPTAKAVQELVTQATHSSCPEGHPIWSITPYMDCPGDYPRGSYRFEWEREWRHVGDLHFDENDAAFLIIPEDLHSAATAFFLDVLHENLGPAYFCPFIDAQWNRRQIRDAFLRHGRDAESLT